MAGSAAIEEKPRADGKTLTTHSESQPTILFRPSVLIQQVFSLLKQSPTGSVRLADVRRVSPIDLGDETLGKILDHPWRRATYHALNGYIGMHN